MKKRIEQADYTLEWEFPRFRGGYHKLPNLTQKEAKRLFTLVWHLRATKAKISGKEGVLKEKER